MVTKFNEFILKEASSILLKIEELDPTKDFSVVTNNAELYIIAAKTVKCVEEIVYALGGDAYTNIPSGSSAQFKSALKSGEQLFIFPKGTNLVYYFSPAFNKVDEYAPKTQPKELHFKERLHLIEQYPSLPKTLGEYAQKYEQLSEICFISKLDDDIVAKMVNDKNARYGNPEDRALAILWYIREKDGKINYELQKALITNEADIVLKKTEKVGMRFNSSYKNGLIGKLIDWSPDVLLWKFKGVSEYSIEGLLKNYNLDFYFKKIENIKQFFDECISSHNTDKIKYIISHLITHKLLKTPAEYDDVISHVIDSAKKQDIRLERLFDDNTFNELWTLVKDPVKEQLVLSKYEYMLKNPKFFSQKWLERARWSDKHRKYDNLYK